MADSPKVHTVALMAATMATMFRSDTFTPSEVAAYALCLYDAVQREIYGIPSAPSLVVRATPREAPVAANKRPADGSWFCSCGHPWPWHQEVAGCTAPISKTEMCPCLKDSTRHVAPVCPACLHPMEEHGDQGCDNGLCACSVTPPEAVSREGRCATCGHPESKHPQGFHVRANACTVAILAGSGLNEYSTPCTCREFIPFTHEETQL